jgi:phosphatidyl-myo-inositol dimannoside synthase
VGEALGISSSGGLRGTRLRVLALVTDAFGGHGGIAQYNSHFLSSLAACPPIEEVIVLPRKTSISHGEHGEVPVRLRQLRPVPGKLAYSTAALAAAQAYRPVNVVFCGHLFMAPLAASIAKLVQARLWVQVHGLEAWEELSTLHRRSIETAAVVTSVSRYTRRRLLKWVGINPSRVKVLPNTVDQRFHPGPKPGYLLERHAIHDAQVLMTVSRLTSWDRYKGHERVIRTLPRVLSEHPDAVYLIAGDGDDRPRLETFAAQLGVSHKIRFVGVVAPAELPHYIRLADVFVMPSTGEGFGIVFLEAMACGIPVIGGNEDGSLDPLADGVLGTAIDPDNGEQLASAICTALRSSAAMPNHASRFNATAFSDHVRELVAASLLGDAFGSDLVRIRRLWL